MSEQSHLDADLSDFSGSAALFPLSNGVFFPQILFPLHIFERRYRRMTADALAGDRLIAMALLKPGWEQIPDDRVPPIFDMVCLSRITAEEQRPDGRYYLVLQGLSRARVLKETPTDRPYRMAELELQDDQTSGLTQSEDQRLREELFHKTQTLHPEFAVNPMFAQVLDGEIPLGVFCDLVAYSLPLPIDVSQRILAELDVVRRSRLVLEAIESERVQTKSASWQFPPNFSRN